MSEEITVANSIYKSYDNILYEPSSYVYIFSISYNIQEYLLQMC